MKLSHVIEELVEEKGLDRSVLSSIICEGMRAAYEKKYPTYSFTVNYNRKSDEIEVFADKVVVSQPVDEEREISLRKARSLKSDSEVGQTIAVPFSEPIGRIEILRAKHIIAQKIRAVEAESVYKEFKPKEGTVVHGVINKCERMGALIKVHETLAFLPKSRMIPGDKCVVGYSVRALLKEVLVEPRNENQLILDRASTDFLVKLFELEIPEVFERLVEIKKIVRAPGYKTKLIVVSHDKNIDPVGTCVGVGGARIKPILRELGLEKIDIISFNQSAEDLVKDALKPAQINRVDIINNAVAQVWLDEDQRSLAIGKMGQNIALASQLTGFDIQIMKNDIQGAEGEAQSPALDENEGDYDENL